jgi:hypothetical protein
MSESEKFPPGNVPYDRVVLCGNTLYNVRSIFLIAGHEPLVIRRDPEDSHPHIWLFQRVGTTTEWVPLVRRNAVVRNFPLPFPQLTVIQDVTQARTVVMLGPSVMVDASYKPESECVEVPFIDLRQIGLNIFGDANSGLFFAGANFAKNTFRGTAVAFAASDPPPRT